MYKKYCLIASILLIIPFLTTSMEVDEKAEEKEQQLIYIQTMDGVTFRFSTNSQLFSQSKVLATLWGRIKEGEFKEKGTADNPIELKSIDSKQLKLIYRFTKTKTDPEKFKWYLQNLNTKALTQLIVASDFLDVKGMLELIAPYLVKQLRDHDVLNAWLKSGGNELLDENKKLSGHMKQYLVHSIKPTPQYLRQKKLIPFDLTGHKGFVYSLAFNPDGTILASGSSDRTIKLWDVKTSLCDVKTGTEIYILTGHKGFVHSVAFSFDGTMLASGSWDKTC